MTSTAPISDLQHEEDDLLCDTIAALELSTYGPVVLLIGWAAEMPDKHAPAIEHAFAKAIGPLICEYRALMVDGGTDCGVMRIAGRRLAELACAPTPIGVAPRDCLLGPDEIASADRFPPERNHRVVAVPGSEFGEELPFVAGLIDRLENDRGVLVVAIGGGEGTRDELDLAMKRGWPVLLINGTDDDAEPGVDFTDVPTVATVDVDDIAMMRRLLRWRLSPSAAQRTAWSRVEIVDQLAAAAQRPYLFLRNLVLLLGIAITAAGVASSFGLSDQLTGLLRWALVLLPLLAAILLSWISRRRRDRRWFAPRAAAEAIKSQVYRFRAGVPPYEDDRNRALAFAAAMGAIETQLGNEIPASGKSGSGSYWPPSISDFVHAEDELLDGFDGGSYACWRVDHQLAYFADRAGKGDRKVTVRLTLVYALSLAATLVAVAGAAGSNIVASAAILAAAGAAAAAWLAYDRLEERLDQSASAAAGLRAALGRFEATEPSGGAGPMHRLVADVEELLASEHADWARSLRQAQQIFDLRELVP